MSNRKVIIFIVSIILLMSFYPTPTSAYELKKIKGNVGSDGSLTTDADYSLNWIEKLFIFFRFSSVGDYIQKNLAVLGTSVDIISATEDHAKLKIHNYATVQDDVYYTNGASWDKNADELVIIFLDGYKYQKSNTNFLPMFQHTTKVAKTKASYDINAATSASKNWETLVLSNLKEENAKKRAFIYEYYGWFFDSTRPHEDFMKPFKPHLVYWLGTDKIEEINIENIVKDWIKDELIEQIPPIGDIKQGELIGMALSIPFSAFQTWKAYNDASIYIDFFNQNYDSNLIKEKSYQLRDYTQKEAELWSQYDNGEISKNEIINSLKIELEYLKQKDKKPHEMWQRDFWDVLNAIKNGKEERWKKHANGLENWMKIDELYIEGLIKELES